MANLYDEFVVTGSRPASACGRVSSSGSSSRKHFGYHIVSKPSYVDESLFGSQHHTRMDENVASFKAPWDRPKPPTPRNTFALPSKPKLVKSEKKGRPLLWCPPPSDNTNSCAHKIARTNKINRNNSTSTSSVSSSSGQLWNTRDNFRHLKHTPTFVDESLFGPRLQEPTFKAPWNERKKGDKRPVRPYLFDPTVSRGGDSSHSARPRPSTALGISRSEKRKQRGSGAVVPVWKP